jgi:hypothetical protein
MSGQDIACHKSATPGSDFVPVTAGSSITLQWNTWPDSHHGPVLDYIAPYSSSAGSLSFVKTDQKGLISGSNPGSWATDQLICGYSIDKYLRHVADLPSLANNFSWTTTIPSSLASGKYVLRHEIIALHSAQQENGAQNYPQCINLQVTGSGSATPSGEAATKFYSPTDPGIEFNLYTSFSSYPIPGPSVWSQASKRAIKKIAKAFTG